MNTTTDLRKKNTLIILRMILDEEPITKVEVAAKTGLTLMTVNTIMNNLFKKRIISECGIADSDSGRKAVLYKINSNAYYIMGVNIAIDAVTIAVSDLNLNLKKRIVLKIGDSDTPKEIIELVSKHISIIMKNLTIKIENVLGLGITVPGFVNESSGVILSFPTMIGWEGISLKTIFEENLGIPVFIEKDSYASAIYLNRNLYNKYKNVVFLTIKGGIGTGILIGESLFRGENGIAGEIGHIVVDVEGPKCNCGNHGCLEVYASDFSIVNDVKRSIMNGEKSDCLDAKKSDMDYLDIEEIIKFAARGDVICRKAILKSAKYIGVAVSNAIKFYDPSYFIINSKWIKEIDGVSDIITNIVKENSTLMQQDKINLVFIDDEDVYLKGALVLVSEHTLMDIGNNKLIL